MSKRTSDFWVVTSFFNPAGYRSHAEKFRVFRDRIGAPLLAVELSYGPEFELGPGDADRLLQFRSDQVLWQKERLLNLAIESLPPECEFVAWVDADVVFQRSDWAERTREALDSQSLVQPYGRVFDLPPGVEPSGASEHRALMSRESFAAVSGNGGFDPKTAGLDMMEVGSPGHAWAMRRAPLQEVGLYDALIVGSGDAALAMAALGHTEAYAQAHRMNPNFAAHYRRWAASFQAVAGGGLGMVPGDLYHIWHGQLADRGYGARYPGMEPFAFDPATDLTLDENGAWRWASEKPGLHAYVADFFRSRREDG